jgi:hypothetical protein
MIGRTYLERGKPVTVLTRWANTKPGDVPAWLVWHHPPKGTPRNVLIRRETTGELVVRPFRGLRRPADRVRSEQMMTPFTSKREAERALGRELSADEEEELDATGELTTRDR